MGRTPKQAEWGLAGREDHPLRMASRADRGRLERRSPCWLAPHLQEASRKLVKQREASRTYLPLKGCIPFKCVGETLPWEFRGRGAEGPLSCPSPQYPDMGQTSLRTSPLGVQRAALDRCQAI